ncbi:MAG TPA: potassium channel family protein [Ktedonobacterales bacterium]|nr:potassium channel family protein [Ktedonobacterales bacterium]
MHDLSMVSALLLIFVVLFDTFETIILPRRIRRRVRITTVVYRITWLPWAALAHRMKNPARRESFLSFYGPLALLFLLFVWAVGLVVGFGLMQWGLGSHVVDALSTHPNFGSDLYMSGTTFFTLGLGDVAPRTGPERFATVVESGVGFAFLAVVIGYLPILYQAFSRREVNVALLDARAGSPPTGVELVRRLGAEDGAKMLTQILGEWEHWSSELLESHLSYPSLGYFRSQHENQSWIAALTTILDACALVMTGLEGVPRQQARLTFAMARHAAVDLSQVFEADIKRESRREWLSDEDFENLRALLRANGLALAEGPAAEAKLAHLRGLYEPYVSAIADRLLTPLPPWLPVAGARDDWQTSPDE